jgi:phosphoribosyl 1,2-cyclic phosphodiesterase
VRATLWGCRGSIASPGPETVRYGGNTPCVEVRPCAGGIIVLDAGTGIRRLGSSSDLQGVSEVHLLLTHLHLDHVEGIPFFPPLWSGAVELNVWGPPSPVGTLADRIARYLSPPLFPLEVKDIPGTIKFRDVPEEEWKIGTVRLRAQPIIHPGPTVGYRLEEDGRSLAYLPDHEPALGGDFASRAPEWISGLSLADGVDVLIHDAQFTDEEYPAKIGWGHSSLTHAIDFARRAAVRRLVLFHHDPARSDGELARLEEQASALWSGTGDAPSVAFEGMLLEL